MSVNDWNGQGFLIETVVSGSSTTTITGHCEGACLWGQECPWHLTLVCLGYGNVRELLCFDLCSWFKFISGKLNNDNILVKKSCLERGKSQYNHWGFWFMGELWSVGAETLWDIPFWLCFTFPLQKTLFPFVMTFYFIWLLLRVILMYNKRR